ncbi:MAG: hypothetical protein RMK61_09195 [Bacteroidota bacterium]|nr:hypothetical protein [Bacteroidota bacterium]
MTEEHLRQPIAEGESLMVEFKGEETRPVSDDELVASTPATYRRLGQQAADVRQRGFEPIQQEQMMLQHVEPHGRITRREAAELCRLSPPQAYRLLQRLVHQGQSACREALYA